MEKRMTDQFTERERRKVADIVQKHLYEACDGKALSPEDKNIAEQLRREGEQRGIQKGIQKGRLEGIQEGRKEEALKIARAMLANSLDHHSVMKMTGLSEDELAEIRH